MEYIMENFLTYVMWVMLATMVAYILYAVRGPSVWDRLLAMNLVSTKAMMVMIIFASMSDTAYLLDLAIISILFGFIGTIFIALFIQRYKLGKVITKNKAGAKTLSSNPKGGKA